MYFNLDINEGTNPKILVDFNDSSPLIFANQSFLINNTLSFNHIFPGSGYYDVNITVFNLVSTVSKIIRVS